MSESLTDPAPQREGSTPSPDPARASGPDRPDHQKPRPQGFDRMTGEVDITALRRPSPGAVVVYKRRKVTLPDGGGAAAPATDAQRHPRVFQLPGQAAEGAPPAADQDAAAEAPLRRRRRRNAMQRPGEVHHIVLAPTAHEERPLSANGAMGAVGAMDAASAFAPVEGVQDPRYLAAVSGLAALDRTLEAVQRARRFKAEIDGVLVHYRAMVAAEAMLDGPLEAAPVDDAPVDAPPAFD
jgi:hypothetical protein